MDEVTDSFREGMVHSFISTDVCDFIQRIHRSWGTVGLTGLHGSVMKHGVCIPTKTRIYKGVSLKWPKLDRITYIL